LLQYVTYLLSSCCGHSNYLLFICIVKSLLP
jgi:hypothetical protein